MAGDIIHFGYASDSLTICSTSPNENAIGGYERTNQPMILALVVELCKLDLLLVVWIFMHRVQLLVHCTKGRYNCFGMHSSRIST